MARILESVFIDGPAGKLEALHEGPEDGVAIDRVAVVCHPHPLHGGTLHNKVVFRLARGIRNAGSAVIRFNFRGAGLSDGKHDDGKGEQDDVRAVVAFAKESGIAPELGGDFRNRPVFAFAEQGNQAHLEAHLTKCIQAGSR